MLHLEGEQALVKRLTTEFPVTSDQAVTAMNVAWMALACGAEELKVAELSFEQVGDGIQVFQDDGLIAVLEFDAGVLPRKVVPFVPVVEDDEDGWDAWDAFHERTDFLAAHSAARAA